MTPPASEETHTPQVVAMYGWLGLIPFLVPPFLGWALPAASGLAEGILVAYGALILSFLGGARWGLAVRRTPPDALTISLAMLPTLVALVLVATPSLHEGWRLIGLASALALHWLWDIRSRDLPSWYPRLRTTLTVGAIAGLLFGSVVFSG
jgi:hypothetical protein